MWPHPQLRRRDIKHTNAPRINEQGEGNNLICFAWTAETDCLHLEKEHLIFFFMAEHVTNAVHFVSFYPKMTVIQIK